MATLTYETTEYRAPEQAALHDVFIPTGGFATDISVTVTDLNLLPERVLGDPGIGASIGFDVDGQRLFFKPTQFAPLLDGDTATVQINWLVAGTTHSVDILVRGRTGNEAEAQPDYAGTTGADVLVGTSESVTRFSEGDVFVGLGGDDLIYGDIRQDYLNGGVGDDYLEGGLGLVGGLPTGAGGGDRLFGEDGDDVLIADTPEEAFGLFGGDYLDGGAGDDRLVGTAGGDVLHGGTGDDKLTGLRGGDRLDGGLGFDVVDYAGSTAVVALFGQVDSYGIGGRFANTPAGGYVLLDGENGIPPRLADTGWYNNSSGDEYVSIEQIVGSAYDDLVYGALGGTVARLGAGDDLFDNDHRSEAQDKAYGEAGDDRIWTGGGADYLFGGAGDDELWGEHGNDLIAGGSGDDLLVGGWGRDVYRFGLTADDGFDTIRGFEPGWDKLDVADDVPLVQLLYGQTLEADGDLLLRYDGLSSASHVTLAGLGTTLDSSHFI